MSPLIYVQMNTSLSDIVVTNIYKGKALINVMHEENPVNHPNYLRNKPK